MRMKTSVSVALATFGAGAAALGGVTVPAAKASPPIPLYTKLDTLARSQTMAAGELGTPAGTDSVSSVYELAPGANSGWRSAPGTQVFAVTGGALTVHAAKGCTTTEYKAGQAAVLPAGTYAVANAGSAPVTFVGVFSKLPKGTAKPLLDGKAGAGPAACTDMAGYRATSLAETTLAEYVRGTMVPLAAYGKSLHAHHAAAIPIEAGKDVAVSSVSFLPGFSSGWITHAPALTIITKGTVVYYEAIDGQCVKSEEYGAGQAYNHVGGLHIANVVGDEPAEGILVWFNLPHDGKKAIPVFGDALDEIDFTPIPPAECAARPF